MPVESTDNHRTDRRAARVRLLLALVAFLAFADFGLTIGFMLGPGMFEWNPIARAIAESTGSPLALGAYRAGCAGFGLIVLDRWRRRRSAEAAAWLTAAVHLAVMVMWTAYLVEVCGLDPEAAGMGFDADPMWVAMR